MRVYLVERWQADAVDVYVVDGKPPARVLRLLAAPTDRDVVGDFMRWDEIPPELGVDRVPATLRLRAEVLDAIVDARAEIRPADTTAAAALDDARAVRDRALTLLEALALVAAAPGDELIRHVTGGAGEVP